jgi:flavin-dependent dehydrogenase
LGDAAGLVTPLTGNGMSMAMHASKIAAGHLHKFLQKKTTRSQMETNYIKDWQQQFKKRLRYSRIIQYFFGKNLLTNLLVRFLKTTPTLTRWLILQTHGKTY